jgi:hypothetical protein
VNFGGSLGWMGAGILGLEVDFGYSPHFFETDDVTTLDGNVTSFMGNVIIGIPIGGQTGGGGRMFPGVRDSCVAGSMMWTISSTSTRTASA